MRDEDVYRDSPLVLLLIGDDHTVVHCSKAGEQLLGRVVGRHMSEILDPDSEMLLDELMSGLSRRSPPSSQVIHFRRSQGDSLVLASLVDRIAGEGGRPWLRITALNDPVGQGRVARLAETDALMRNFIETLAEATWCIEFIEPVDLTMGDHEIVRQVFENDCRWRMCNAAMARLYSVPDDVDFNQQPVALYFRRNPENEAFVRQIIESNFSVDNALSIETRHDGSTMYVENSVRCQIESGRLFRMWGTLRDITRFGQAQNRLMQHARDVSNILSSIPDAILVIDRSRRLLAVNPAFEALFGWSAQQLLGREIDPFLDLEKPLPGGRRWYGVDQQRWTAEVKMQAGVTVLCDIQISPVGDEVPHRFVLSLRPAQVANESLSGAEHDDLH